MTTTIKKEQSESREELQADLEGLESELEAIRRELAVKRTRIGGIELAAFFALLLGIAAMLAVAFKLDDNQNAATPMHNQLRTSMPAASDSGSAAAVAGSRAAGAGTVNVQLGEMYIKPAVSSISAGRVTFTVQNGGTVTHEMVVIRTDTPAGKLPMKSGEASEKGSVGEVSDLAAGASDSLTINLKPGHYDLICNLPGHYSGGMYTNFQVTG